MTKILSVFSRASSTYWSLRGWRVALVTASAAAVRPTLTTVLPLRCTGFAVPEITSWTASLRGALRLSSCGFGSSSAVRLGSPADGTALGADADCFAVAGAPHAMLVVAASDSPSSPTATLRTWYLRCGRKRTPVPGVLQGT